MSCKTCSNSGLPKGCKNNGACASGGCEKMAVFDWLADVSQPASQACQAIEVRFKNGRKNFYKNYYQLPLQMGDTVVVECRRGQDVGIISLTGELVRVQMQSKQMDADANLPKIFRKANSHDLKLWEGARAREKETMHKSRVLAQDLGLAMKISDVEFQGDGSKAVFYYTADQRVDFRELLKIMNREFSVRIEMKQVGARQEAARLGGIGSCGRELCCSTWLTDFRTVSTTAVRYQQLAINQSKLAGQCGKLKCCLNYELDSYMDALKDFPDQKIVLKTKKGDAHFQKMDIFKEKLWYAYAETWQWVELPLKGVKKIVAMNAQGQTPSELEEFLGNENPQENLYDHSLVEGNLHRFDRKKRSKNLLKKRKNTNR